MKWQTILKLLANSFQINYFNFQREIKVKVYDNSDVSKTLLFSSYFRTCKQLDIDSELMAA